MAYPTGPLPQHNLFGSSQGVVGDATFQLQGNDSLFSEATDPERTEFLLRGGDLTVSSVISAARLKSPERVIYWKPAFLFGDDALDPNGELSVEEDRWIFKIGDDKYYLPPNRRHFPLSYFICVTQPRKMPWSLTQGSDFVRIGKFLFREATGADPPRLSRGLLPSLRGKYIPVGEMPSVAPIFISSFLQVDRNYPAGDFRALGWVHSSPSHWWSKITSFVLRKPHASGWTLV